MHYRNLLAGLFVIMAASAAAAQGLIIPDEPNLPPLALIRHKVRVEIDRQAAVTTLEQVFLNNTERQLEATYVFPIPKGAAMSRFTMIVNGKEKAGELVEKNQARNIYNSIVNRAQDPGLLEYLGGEVFRASIFPILPRATQTVTLRFEQILPSQDSLVSYIYPVRAGAKRGATVQGDFTIEATLKSAAPILNIYSPSHAVNVVRASEHEARVSFSARHTTLEKDFQLYYSVSDKEVGLNLVTFRPDPKQPGFFMMLVSPRSTLQVERIVERDVVFVVDVSGSMAGEKIKQARNALKYLVSKLNDADRFNIVTFSSFADPWQKTLVSAKERRQDALAFADTIIAQGGTDIAGALDAALSFHRDPARPAFVVFMTDGKPTMGETTDPGKILAKVQAARVREGGESLRLFTWGVGYDVDTHLLDDMALRAGGVSEYVRPEEDIAAKVAAFANKASQPVLTGLDLKVIGTKVQLVNLHPHRFPDLYAGSQLVLMGRYTGEGDVALQLTGRVNGKTETFTYEGKFAAGESRYEFVEILWAQRRIGHLLEQIRLNGESKELVDDVIRLSTEYSIPTPYTSALILEDNARPVAGGRRGGEEAKRDLSTGGGAFKNAADAFDKAPPASAPAPKAEPAKPEAAERERLAEQRALSGFKAKDGKEAVDATLVLRKMKEAEQAGDKVTAFRKSAGTRFFFYRETWIDERFDAGQAVTCVKFGSAAYFRLIEKNPALIDAFKLGTNLVFMTAAGKAVAVGAAGEETLTDAQVDEIFKAKK